MTKSRVRRVAAPLAVAALRVVGGWLFERRYLRGRHFETSRAGWAWVLRSLFTQKLAGFNRHVPWPVSPFIQISEPAGPSPQRTVDEDRAVVGGSGQDRTALL